jgi:hypothetical protein
VVVNLLHQFVRLENPEACRILQLLDGTRDLDQLVAEVHVRRPRVHLHLADAGAEDANTDATRDSVQNFLIQAMKLGLLFR